MATLLSAAGYPLVADDLLPVELQGDDVMCVPVGTELRVREKVETLLERFDPRTTRRLTVDERHAVAPQTTGAKKLPLAAIVVPWPDREVGEVTARRLAAGDAAVTLARCQRVECWSSPSMLRTQFEAISTVVRSVPVLMMRVPWSPPFSRILGQRRALGFRPRTDGGGITGGRMTCVPVSGAVVGTARLLTAEEYRPKSGIMPRKPLKCSLTFTSSRN